MGTVLVVDDKEMMRDSVGSTLRRAGFTVVAATDGASALDVAAARRPNVVVTDMKMPGLTGLELLERLRAIDEELPVVVMTAFGTVDTAVSAMKLGAFDYITKPFEGDELVITVKRALAHAKVIRENALLKATPIRDTRPDNGRTGMDRIIGESPAMRRVKQQVMAVAESQGTIMICGESGTGKEVIARAIHEISPRRSEPFLAVNCAALSESLLESELFGHEKGAFTGAEKTRKGRFELADRGTLLLDEVSEVSPSIQAKLLRVLQERSFERVGSSVTIGVDVRVIATSNRDLPRAVARGDFRQDLFFRLNVLPIHLPPMRDRVEDVPSLAEHFITLIAEREGVSGATVMPEALGLMQQYSWPGNVRELQNICERAVVLRAARRMSDDERIIISRELIEPWLQAAAPVAHDLHAVAQDRTSQPDLNGYIEPKETTNGHAADAMALPSDRTLEEIEREAIIQTLQRFNGHRQKTAKALGIGVRTLGLKLKKWKEAKLVASSL